MGSIVLHHNLETEVTKETFWKLWDESLKRTLSLKLNPSFGSDFNFKGITEKETEKVKKTIKYIFSGIIRKRDEAGFRREITRLDCTRLSYEIQQELNNNGIRSIIVTGDYSFCGEAMYGVTEEYIFAQFRLGHSGGLGLHSWLVLENYLMIDATRMIFHEKESFLSHEIIGEPLIADVENIPPGLSYHPFILGEEYLHKIGSLLPIDNVTAPEHIGVSRNAPCPCDSGLRFKCCCGIIT
jgi:hypothetical protein